MPTRAEATVGCENRGDKEEEEGEETEEEDIISDGGGGSGGGGSCICGCVTDDDDDIVIMTTGNDGVDRNEVTDDTVEGGDGGAAEMGTEANTEANTTRGSLPLLPSSSLLPIRKLARVESGRWRNVIIGEDGAGIVDCCVEI